MEWLLNNWVLVLFGGGMIAMHLFGHGHGGHGGRGGCGGQRKDAAKAEPTAETIAPPIVRRSEAERDT
jgi:hypothetical protein